MVRWSPKVRLFGHARWSGNAKEEVPVTAFDAVGDVGGWVGIGVLALALALARLASSIAPRRVPAKVRANRVRDRRHYRGGRGPGG